MLKFSGVWPALSVSFFCKTALLNCFEFIDFMAVDDKKKHKDRMYEGQKFAELGHKLCPQDFECLRWASILTGSISDISGNKEKIQQGNLFKVKSLV